MQNILEELEQTYEAQLNDSIFSLNSIYGIAIIVIVLFLIIVVARRFGHVLLTIFMFMILCECLHLTAFYTVVGEWLPILQTIFKYDTLVALAQLFVGTPVSEGLLYIQAFFYVVFSLVGWYLEQAVRLLWQGIVFIRQNTGVFG